MRRLGDLEAEIMDVVWQSDGPLKVGEVRAGLGPSRALAYTTVKTVLDNLSRKGWLDRVPSDGKAWRYRPALSREQAAIRALREVLDASGDPDAVLLHFAESASEKESALLRRGLRRRNTQS
jgi:predicted transcriptional regulator